MLYPPGALYYAAAMPLSPEEIETYRRDGLVIPADFHLPEAFSWRVLASTSGASGPIEAPQFRAAAWSVALLISSP